MSLDVNRRTFLMTSSATAAAMCNRTYASANDRVSVAVIGLGGQGKAHLSSFNNLPNVDIRYVCDVDSQRLADGNKTVPNAKPVDDLRRILDDPSIDAVSIATPDHWHTPAALLALSAGKHVYVEKPCSHNLPEGRWLVNAAAKYGKVVQHGTQSRSSPFIMAAMEQLRQGLIGDVLIARAWNVQYRGAIGKATASEPPTGFDYESWVGPAPFVPFQKNRYHYTWHWWYDFGTGDAGNDGVHEIDIARWGLGVDTHPSQVAAIGGKYVHDDDQQYPDTMTAAFEYPGDGQIGNKRQLIFEMRLWSHYHPLGMDNGNEFLGTKGRMVLTKRGKVEVFDERGDRKNLDLPAVATAGISTHQQNFVDAIRGQKAPHADATVGHLSAALPHLANLACRAGQSFRFDPSTETIIDAPTMQNQLGRSYRDHWGRPQVTL